MPCPACCGYNGDNLEYHYRNSAYCRPRVPLPDDSSKCQRDGTSAKTFARRVTVRVGTEMLTAHTDNYVKIEHLDIMRNLLVQVVDMVVTFIRDEDKMGDTPMDLSW